MPADVRNAIHVEHAHASEAALVQLLGSLGESHRIRHDQRRRDRGGNEIVGLDVPFHCSALGKVFLAHRVVTLPAGRLEQRTDRTITTRDALAAELDQVRRRGFAVAAEELEPGLVAIAAPVRDSTGHVVAALSVSGPSVRLRPERIAQTARLTVGAARDLSATLGYDDDARPTTTASTRTEEGAA
jgi:DNA-binding IclR family transcriptional regulator